MIGDLYRVTWVVCPLSSWFPSISFLYDYGSLSLPVPAEWQLACIYCGYFSIIFTSLLFHFSLISHQLTIPLAWLLVPTYITYQQPIAVCVSLLSLSPFRAQLSTRHLHETDSRQSEPISAFVDASLASVYRLFNDRPEEALIWTSWRWWAMVLLWHDVVTLQTATWMKYKLPVEADRTAETLRRADTKEQDHAL